jgi:hypothetical protein
MVQRTKIGLYVGLAAVVVLIISQTAIAQARSGHRYDYRSWSKRVQRPGKVTPPAPPSLAPTLNPTPSPAPTGKSFLDTFSTNYVLEETGAMAESSNPNWWLSSGGRFIVQNSVAKTIQGSLPTTDSWYREYAKYNPVDTDGGAHPQNIFRLVTKSKWQNFAQEAHFKINKYNLSNSSERYNPNGLLFFNHYVDQNNLYYTGIRVDGTAIVKKKINGNYYTISQTKIFDGTYNRSTNPNLLPVGAWIGLKSDVTTNTDGTVSIKVYVDKNNSGNWQLVINAKDNGSSFGGKAIAGAGYAGIRTDFMDVEMDNYKVSEF